jgi:hypothetical protein
MTASIVLRSVRTLVAVALCALPALHEVGAQSLPVNTQNLPLPDKYASFSFVKGGAILGDDPAGLVFADYRTDKSLFAFWSRRQNVVWAAAKDSAGVAIEVAAPLTDSGACRAHATLLGYDANKNAYVKTVGDSSQICQVDPAATVKQVASAPGNLWNPASGAPAPFPLHQQRKSLSAGMVLGDDRADVNQEEEMSMGKVSWVYHHGDYQPSEIRVVLIQTDGRRVFSPHATLVGFDHQGNGYVQLSLEDSAQAVGGARYRIDSAGMPTRIDAFPPALWLNETPAPAPAQAVAPPPPTTKGPVSPLANGKFMVNFTDPETNQQTSAEMERVAGSKDPDTPLDGLYHDEKHMLSVRDGEVTGVQVNRIPMGFKLPTTNPQ